VVSEGRAELGRYADAAEARDAGRRLLAAGITPEVRRDGESHVLSVAAADLAVAAGVLSLDGMAPTSPTPAGAVVDLAPPPGDPTSTPAPPAAAAADPAEEVDPAAVADLVVDERGFVVVLVADDATVARSVATRLLDHGIGCELASAFATGHANPMTTSGDPESVQVLEIDADRALTVLGLDALPARLTAPPSPATTEAGDAPAAVAEVPPAPTARLRRRAEAEEVRSYLGGRVQLTRRQARTMVAVYLAALVLVPLSFFYLTRWILAPDVEEPELPTQQELPSVVVRPWGPAGDGGAPPGP
jgi:hypothetical protein